MSCSRPGKRERLALREAQMARKQIINANLSNPVERDTWSTATKSGNIVRGYSSTSSRDSLMGGTHTTGFHSSSIRGHNERGSSHSQRWAKDGFND